jgi:hypothetical protein
MRIITGIKHSLQKTQSANKPPLLIALAILIMFCPSVMMADLATYDEMHNVAQNWLTYIIAETGDWAGAVNPRIVEAQDIVLNDTLLARYFEVSSGGYIIVPALKELPAVKAYSDQYLLDIHDENGFALLLREVLQHRTQLYAEIYGSLEASQPPNREPLFDFKNREKWDIFSVSPKQFMASGNKNLMSPTEGVGPLLTTSWYQGPPYSDLCPQGDGGQCLVGCVATAAAQIIYYHQWPPNGEGSHTYYWGGDQSCEGNTPGEWLSADFSDPYIYDNSPASVAEISYEMGVAYEMNYGACASGAYTMYGQYVFPAYFMYDESTRQENRVSHTAYSWFNLIKADINKGRPILYRIKSHAIVCDGWRVAGSIDQYHFNYGWGGSQNAWYAVDNLHCNWSGCDPMVEQMVINIIPENGSPWLGGSEFTDDLGDGDRLLENGETIELAVTIANYGGAPVTDVEINLTIDDASLTITDGSAYLGTINDNDSVANIDDPFVFDIPVDYISRTDSFFIEISWNGSELDTLVVEKAIGNISILLVDDDENDDCDEYYRRCLNNFRIPYNVWEYAAFSTPDASYLSSYDVVIWFTGDYRSYPMNTNEIISMEGYLDNGGKLFLSGQRIAAQLNTLDQVFLNDYLKAEYHGSQNIPVLETENGQVFDTGYMVCIQGINSAGNQEYPDFITPINGSVAEMKYLGEDYYGGISYSGDYQLVFFSVGFEAVVSGDSRWRDSDSVMTDIMNFFGYQKPNSCPSVSDLTISPGDPTHLLNHTPDFSWSYSDLESSPQTQYHLQVSNDNSWMYSEMWDTGPISGPDAQITYAGAELLDGETYYIRVRTCDGTLWSGWTYKSMRMNSVPPPATDLTPADLQGVIDAAPTLTLTNADDGENDVLEYTFEVYGDPELTILYDQVNGHPSGYGTTSWTVSNDLEDNNTYYWRARGSDPFEDGMWSEPVSFWVNSVNAAPEAFDLVSPVEGEKIQGLAPTFNWTASSDADPYDLIDYTLYYTTSPTFSTSISVSDLDTTSYALPGELEYGTTYYWRVKANDLFGGETYSSQTYSFTTITRGDANGDSYINVADAVFLINFIFKGGAAPDPLESGDANCDGNPNIGDAVYIISYVFSEGPEPGCH